MSGLMVGRYPEVLVLSSEYDEFGEEQVTRLENSAWPSHIDVSREFLMNAGPGRLFFDGKHLTIEVSNGSARYRVRHSETLIHGLHGRSTRTLRFELIEGELW